MANQFVGYDNIIPLVAPVAGTTGTITSPYMDLKNAHKASFLISFGAITSTTTTDALTITVQGATVEEGTEAAVDFRYRLSGAVGANTWGAVTTVAAATGLPMLAPTADNMAVWVELDPDALGASDYRFVRFLVTPAPASQMEAYVLGAVGIIEARYKQTTHISATASASA
jgi:hypothetical protein